jgi:hypothetical protein
MHVTFNFFLSFLPLLLSFYSPFSLPARTIYILHCSTNLLGSKVPDTSRAKEREKRAQLNCVNLLYLMLYLHLHLTSCCSFGFFGKVRSVQWCGACIACRAELRLSACIEHFSKADCSRHSSKTVRLLLHLQKLVEN